MAAGGETLPTDTTVELTSPEASRPQEAEVSQAEADRVLIEVEAGAVEVEAGAGVKGPVIRPKTWGIAPGRAMGEDRRQTGGVTVQVPPAL